MCHWIGNPVWGERFDLQCHCRAAEATHDAQDSLKNMEAELQKPANWQPHASEGVWTKLKKAVGATPPTPAEKTAQSAKDAIAATQRAADEAVTRARKVGSEVYRGLWEVGGRGEGLHEASSAEDQSDLCGSYMGPYVG